MYQRWINYIFQVLPLSAKTVSEEHVSFITKILIYAYRHLNWGREAGWTSSGVAGLTGHERSNYGLKKMSFGQIK